MVPAKLPFVGCTNFLFAIVYVSSGFIISKCLDLKTTMDPVDATTRSLLLQSLRRNAHDLPNTANDGWKTIQVFVGSPTKASKQAKTQELPPRFYSQARQDELILALLRNQTNGYFIDLAANDAHLLSNTAALEHSYNWTGLCIEPNPIYWYNLTHYRPNCQVVASVVGKTRDDQVYFRYNAGDHGGIADAGFDNGKRWQRESELVATVPLLEVLERNNVPTVIDYLSLDVEGAESFILLNFPLEQYRIKIITAERLKGEIRSYLQNHGYEFVKRLSTWGESLWVHSDYTHELDMEAVDRFPFPIGAASVESMGVPVSSAA
ncbi:hypothetical protein MPSEU_000115600 [Mayamaea pseudoterrestris]|nr:hypothetical protein MPSEU_000115600 [Mayamaea pseudoterrestris]